MCRGVYNGVMSLDQKQFAFVLGCITVVVFLASMAFVYAQEGVDISVDMFFSENKDALVVDRVVDDVYEYGFKVQHNGWYEEHVFFGLDKSAAVSAFSASL